MLRVLPTSFLRLSLGLLFAMLLSGCFWGQADGQLFFKVSGENYEQYTDLLYPGERAERWAEIFSERETLCSGGEAECDIGDLERSDLVELYLPYETDRARGMITQKGDLQITSHLKVGKTYQSLAVGAFEDWAYMENSDFLYGLSGDGCSSETEAADRTGVGRCLRSELLQNPAGYEVLDEDLRLVISINLPGADDIRSTRCQDQPSSFVSADWTLPRTLRVNYNANEPEEVEDGIEVYGEETPPLAQCDIEVYSRLQLGIEVFSADRYGADDDNGACSHNGAPCHLGLVNGEDETLVGTVELEELVLPGEDGQARAKGRYNIRYTSDRFSARDGKVEISGDFDVEVRLDREQVDEPDRNLDLEDTDSQQTGA